MKQYVLIHINKCAGGSLTKTLGDYKGIEFYQIHMVENYYKLKDTFDKNVIIFIRDPVSRFVASFNFMNNRFKKPKLRKYLKRFFGIEYDRVPDLEKILSETRSIKTIENKKYVYKECKEKFDFVTKFPHITSNIHSYLTYESDEYLDKLDNSKSIFFVGKVENIKEDYQNLINKIENDTGVPIPKELELSNTIHKSKKVGKFLSKNSIKMIREYCKKEYECIQKLIYLGYIKEEYMEKIKNRAVYEY